MSLFFVKKYQYEGGDFDIGDPCPQDLPHDLKVNLSKAGILQREAPKQGLTIQPISPPPDKPDDLDDTEET